MIDKNQHIKIFLKYYLDLSEAPEYAVMITAPWGAGKTYFIEEFLRGYYRSKGVSDGERQYLYISLYGMSNFSEIEMALFQQLHPELSSKGMVLAAKVMTSLLKATSKIDLSEFSLHTYLTKTDGYLLVFDDLERCSIQFDKILGYLNFFVEHGGHKMLIVANESEIGREDASYKRVREKLIGKTFEYQTPINEVVDSLLEALPPEVRNFCKNNRETVIQIFMYSGYNNFRLLKQSLSDFVRFYNVLEKRIIDKEDLLLDLFKRFIVFSFEAKAGESSIKQIFFSSNNLHDYEQVDFNKKHELSDEDKNKIKLNKLRGKYDSLINLLYLIFEEEVWINLIDKNILDAKYINSYLLEQIIKQQETEVPGWLQIWDIYSLNEGEFEEAFEQCIKEIENRSIRDIYELRQYAGIFLFLIKKGIKTKQACNAINQIYELVDYLAENKILPSKEEMDYRNKFSRLDYDAWAGHSIWERDSDEYKEFLKYVTKKIEEHSQLMYPQVGQEILQNMESDKVALFAKLIGSNRQFPRYNRSPIMRFISVEEFIATFKRLGHEQMSSLFEVLENRYKQPPLYLASLLDELEWWEQVKDNVDAEIIAHEGNIVKLKWERLGLIIDYIIQILQKSGNEV